MGEPEIIHAAVPAGAEILELGCGAGRLTHPLLELGHPVVAVDQSAEMLAHIRGAEKIHADIETLDIGRALPVVLLSSQLVNTSDAQQRSAFLRTCRRHVQQDGVVVIQRHDPDLANLPPKEEVYERLGFRFSFLSPKLEGHSLSAVMHYRFEDREWLHPFTTRILDDDEIEAELVAAELRVDGWLDPKRTWLTARPL